MIQAVLQKQEKYELNNLTPKKTRKRRKNKTYNEQKEGNNAEIIKIGNRKTKENQ